MDFLSQPVIRNKRTAICHFSLHFPRMGPQFSRWNEKELPFPAIFSLTSPSSSFPLLSIPKYYFFPSLASPESLSAPLAQEFRAAAKPQSTSDSEARTIAFSGSSDTSDVSLLGDRTPRARRQTVSRPAGLDSLRDSLVGRVLQGAPAVVRCCHGHCENPRGPQH